MKKKRKISWQSWLLAFLASWLIGSALVLFFLEEPNWVPLRADLVQLIPITERISQDYDAGGSMVKISSSIMNQKVAFAQLTVALIIAGASLLFWLIEKGRGTEPDIGQVSPEAAPSAAPDEPSM